MHYTLYQLTNLANPPLEVVATYGGSHDVQEAWPNPLPTKLFNTNQGVKQNLSVLLLEYPRSGTPLLAWIRLLLGLNSFLASSPTSPNHPTDSFLSQAEQSRGFATLVLPSAAG